MFRHDGSAVETYIEPGDADYVPPERLTMAKIGFRVRVLGV
ncbi:MAG: hypothetical protein VYB28_02155 [Gemmatimonadota bacterium]|nr:hypothetical protein [Gemmatimonadota bacterium]